MTLANSVLFGLVEGLTEFVPVSSTAHMLLLQRLLSIPPSDAVFSYVVIVQMGAIAALLIYFRRDFATLLAALPARPFSSAANSQAWFVILATLPALIAGYALRDVVARMFGNPLNEAAIRFLTAAALMSAAEVVGRKARSLETMSWLDSIIIGLFQVLAVFPGASRSGASIAGGMFRGFTRPSATRFAFLMSAPVMLAAGSFETLGMLQKGIAGELLPVLPLGLLVSAVAGWLSIRWLIAFVGRHRLYTLALYCAAMGLACLLLGAG